MSDSRFSLAMTSVLPPHFISDAVPEKRTADEDNQPPSVRQAQEYVRGQDESVGVNSDCDLNDGRRQVSDTNKPLSSAEAKEETTQPGTEKKSKKTDGKKKRTPRSTNIVNITKCSGFQICNNTNISNHWNINGMSSAFHKSNSKQPNTTQHQQSDSHHRPPLPIPEKVFHCFVRISEEDCTIVSEYITCDWETLREHLFPNMNQLKDYITPIEGKSKKEAVRSILIRWKQVNYKVADVSTLCRVLQKLNEIDALIRLANRHGIK